MAENKVNQAIPARRRKVSIETIKLLVADLDSQDGLVRVKARKSLAAIGRPAIDLLVKALASKKEWVRWEAAKTPGQIGDAKATAALIIALEDKMFDVRWLAAEGLNSIGHEALVPLLQALKERPDSIWLREGVHHVLHNMEGGHLNKLINPVLLALEDVEPVLEAPLAVEKALEELSKD